MHPILTGLLIASLIIVPFAIKGVINERKAKAKRKEVDRLLEPDWDENSYN